MMKKKNDDNHNENDLNKNKCIINNVIIITKLMIKSLLCFPSMLLTVDTSPSCRVFFALLLLG